MQHLKISWLHFLLFFVNDVFIYLSASLIWNSQHVVLLVHGVVGGGGVVGAARALPPGGPTIDWGSSSRASRRAEADSREAGGVERVRLGETAGVCRPRNLPQVPRRPSRQGAALVR
jgi:hypothetical protein